MHLVVVGGGISGLAAAWAAHQAAKSRGKSIHDAKVLSVLAAAGNDMRTRIFAIDQLAI